MIGVLMDDTDPLVTVMKVEKAPQETYADIGGLDAQIQEIKVQTLPPAVIYTGPELATLTQLNNDNNNMFNVLCSFPSDLFTSLATTFNDEPN